MVAVRGCSIWDAACPVCKCTRASLEEAESRLLGLGMAETAMDVDDTDDVIVLGAGATSSGGADGEPTAWQPDPGTGPSPSSPSVATAKATAESTASPALPPKASSKAVSSASVAAGVDAGSEATIKGTGKGKRKGVANTKAAAFSETAVEEEESGAPAGEAGASDDVATIKGTGKGKRNAVAKAMAGEVGAGDAGGTSKGMGKGKGQRKAVAKAKAAAFAETATEEASSSAAGEVHAGDAGATSKGKGKGKGKQKAVAKATAAASAETGTEAEPTSPEDDWSVMGAVVGDDIWLCNSCGRYEPMKRLRVQSKTKGTFKCSGCHVTQQVLRRINGSWPSDTFRGLSEDQKQAFMASVHGAGSTDIADALESLEVLEQHGEQYEDGGEFLPLGVWAKRGFSAEDIALKSHPSDRKLHPVCGPTYRVRILRTANVGSRIIKRRSGNQVAHAQPAASKARCDKPVNHERLLPGSENVNDGDARCVAPKPPAPPSPPSSRSSSSSSSSSSSGHKKKKKKDKKNKKDKKHKKDRKKDKKGTENGKDKENASASACPRAPESAFEKKARETREKMEGKLAGMAATANLKLASATASKIADWLGSVKIVIEDPLYEQVPDVVRSPANSTIEKFSTFKDECDEIIATRGGGTPPFGDVSQLMAELGAARKIVFKAEKMLKQIKQLT